MKNNLPVIQVRARKRGGWLVGVYLFGGEGVAVWQRGADTVDDVRFHLEEAARRRAAIAERCKGAGRNKE